MSARDFFGPRGDELFGDLSTESVRLLSLARESGAPRDEWGNWDGQFTAEELGVPSVDVAHRRSAQAWGAPFAVAVTHDVDTLNLNSWTEYWTRVARDQPSVTRRARLAAGWLKQAWLDRTHERRAWDVSTWREIERSYGFPSTWMIFPEDPSPRHALDCAYAWSDRVYWAPRRTVRLREALRRLADQGCEIGLHASFAAARDAAELRRQRLALEALTGRAVRAVRQHYLRFDADVTPGVHGEAGFEVDSSIGMNRRVGFRAGTSFPFFPSLGGTGHSRTLQVPLVIQDGAFFSEGGLAQDVGQALRTSMRIMDQVERVGGVLTLLFHTHCQHDGFTLELFDAVLAECRRRGAWGGTLSEIRAGFLGN